ncbi:MAG TPA: hypothetical protein DHS57_06470 [Erysipelotrichaceae bacterium]|nr:hypothetical protein [Erysipelotrichaceae bacterium]
MKKLIVIFLVLFFITGCSKTNEIIEEPTTNQEPTIIEEENEEVIEEDKITSYAVISTLEDEDNLYLRLVFMADNASSFFNKDENVINEIVGYANDTKFMDGDLFDTYAKDYQNKTVFYQDVIIENQDIDELSNKIKQLSFDLELDNENIIHNIETIYVNEKTLVYKEYETDFSYNVLDYEVKDNKRYYSLSNKLEFVKFSVPDNIDESVYVALTPSLKEDSEETYVCVYVPTSKKPNPINDQAVECYVVNKGINAAYTCCGSGIYFSYPTKDYDNGYRISSALAALDMVLVDEEDINIYHDISEKYPIITFE